MQYNNYYCLLLSIVILILLAFSFISTGCKTRDDIEEEDTIREIRPEEFKKIIDLTKSSITYYDKDSELFATQVSYKEGDEPFKIVD